MKLKFTFIIAALTTFVVLIGCRTPEKSSGYYNYSVECLGNENNGNIIVKSWGTGRDRNEAEANAEKNALKDIMFKGIRNGKEECGSRPLIVKPNTLENNEVYFNRFFTSTYKKFVAMHREPLLDRTFNPNPRTNKNVAYALTLTVDVSMLKSHLVRDNIID